MQFEEVAKAYRKTDMFGATEAKDPETVVIMVMDELIKACLLYTSPSPRD